MGTSGLSVNAFALLLNLAKPIKSDFKTDKYSKISPFFTLRADIPEILGAWQKESRFGEKDQVEAAEKLAKDDPKFTLPPNDKTLFQTEVFWLTSKAIGTLLLPVAKEAFNTFHNIAGAFYDKDRANADAGWREYLLSEASLKEPGFLNNLGAFVDLTFRFLA